MADDAYSQSDPGTPIVSGAQRYWREINKYEKATSDWHEEGNAIVKVYLDENRERESKQRRFALLWANVETLKPAVYAKPPSVLCSRRYRDKDPIARIAAEIVERCTNTSFDLYDVDEVLRMVRDDRLLPGRGQAWVRYEASFEKDKDAQGQEYDKLAGEKVCVDYVHWSDFGHNLARTWSDVWLVWRRVYKTREEAAERFTEDVADRLVYDAKPPEDKDGGSASCAVIYECWDKRKSQVVWLAKEHSDLLEEPAKPPLSFRRFFPCPEPCYASKTSRSLIPTPDYRYYRDQAKEINDLTAKIDSLTQWLVLKGFVPKGPSGEGGDAIERAIKESSNDVTLVEVESWAAFAEKGGAGKLIDWLPLDMVLKALQGAIQAREQLLQDVYQITGVSDILRGQTDPNETLGAQELKAQTGSRRVRNAKDEIARFARDIGELVAEIVAEMFQPQTLADMSGARYVNEDEKKQRQMQAAQAQQQAQMQQGQMPGQAMQPAQQQPATEQPESPSGLEFDDQVMALLRNDRLRSFRIDVETDSTIQPDEDAEKQRAVEFSEMLGQFMERMTQVLPVAPEMAPVAKEALQFTARRFRAGRNLEDSIESSLQALVQKLNQPRPDPAQQQAEQEMQQSKAEHEQKMAQGAQSMQFEQMEHAQKMQQAQQKFSQDLQNAQAKTDEQVRAVREKAKAKPAPAANGKGAPAQASPDMGEVSEAVEQVGVLMAQAMQMIAQSSQQLSSAAAMMAQSSSAPVRISKQPDGSFVKEPVSVQ